MAARVTHDTTPAESAADHLASWLRAQEKKDLVRFVTIGSVDDGKSTLIGRLLHDAHGLYADQLDAVRRASLKGSTRGAGSSSEIDFSLFTDGLMAEREQGITIDVAYRYFATEKRKFIIADTPGHVQYTRNMATGASTADVAVILVDARLGVLPQTRRHAHIAALLGIPQVVACVNKMDLVGFDQKRFDAIVEELAEIARRVELKGLFVLPVSALAGDNVVTPSTNMPWWNGGTMLEHLETVPVGDAAPSANPANAPVGLRFPVQLVLRPGLDYRGFAGQIVSGTVRTGDEIVALPSGKKTRVVGVDVDGRDVGSARAPMSIALRLADEIDVSRGDMLAHESDLPRSATDLEADLVWMSERALDPGKTYLLKHTTRTVRAAIEVTRLVIPGGELHGVDPETLEAAPAKILALNDIGRVRVRCRAPIFFDPYRVNRGTGAFILIDSVTNDTVAAGMIAGASTTLRGDAGDGGDAGGATDTRVANGPRTQVSAKERRDRLGQSGAVVRVFGASLASARELAFLLERELFDRGQVATVLDANEQAWADAFAAETCARAGLIAIVIRGGERLAVELRGERIDGKDAAELVRRVADGLAVSR
ncbi:MAG: bifunctional enzyme CysN/CysC [Myxococcales bacterium]|nr:bifunctional enzyme CysN/CysC [Myxococcales bacterium]